MTTGLWHTYTDKTVRHTFLYVSPTSLAAKSSLLSCPHDKALCTWIEFLHSPTKTFAYFPSLSFCTPTHLMCFFIFALTWPNPILCLFYTPNITLWRTIFGGCHEPGLKPCSKKLANLLHLLWFQKHYQCNLLSIDIVHKQLMLWLNGSD